MKLLKKLFYGLMIICMIICGMVLVCAMIPGLTDQIALVLYGEKAEGPEQETPLTQPLYPEYTISESSTAGIDWEHMPFQDQTGYRIPSKEQIITTPDQKKKTGYLGVKSDGTELEEQEAEQLEEKLGIGELGSGLQFNELFYPYYAMLTPQMKELYCQIYANAQKQTDAFQPVVEVDTRQLSTVFEAVIGDHPELFFLETGYQCRYRKDGLVIEITLQYNDLTKRLDGAKQEFEQAAERILQGARGLAAEKEKEAYVHDALVEGIAYEAKAKRNQSAYSALVDGETVCAGYARAFQYLMIQLGIPCYYCTGYSGEEHAWNIILVDGCYRNVDVTWDDDEQGAYEYYNKSDLAFSGTHMRKGLSVYLPGCPEEGQSQTISPLVGIEGLINPNPIKPLTLADRGSVFPKEPTDQSADQDEKAVLDEAGLREAGIKASEVLLSLQDYYKDCEAQMSRKGQGQIQFSNCIPASLWESIESAYTSRKHLAGYVEAALKKLEADNFAINLQAVRLGGGYYRLYHTIAVW